MDLSEHSKRLRILIGENNYLGAKPHYEAIVLKARDLGLAGPTVTRGLMGFGASSRLHTAKILRLSTDQLVVIEITDTKERISRILPYIEESITGGLATIECVEVNLYYGRHPDR